MCKNHLANEICSQRAAVKSDPSNSIVWQSLGVNLRRVGAFSEALDALETASVLTPLTVIARFALADCYAYACKHELAKLLYRHIALEDDRAVATVRLAAARSLAFLGDLPAAEQTARKVCREKPTCARAFFDLSFYRGKRGASIGEVTLLAGRAVELEPRNERFRVSLALLLFKQDLREQAIELATSLSPQAIAAVTCKSCLAGLAEIYRAATDDLRLRAVRDCTNRVYACESDINCTALDNRIPK